MKIRITPLNILVSASLVAVIYLLLFKDAEGWRFLGTIPLITLALVCFITDVIFRNFLTDLKRIWIVEVVFIIFATVLLIAFQKL